MTDCIVTAVFITSSAADLVLTAYIMYNIAVQRQTAVTVYLSNKQLLMFVFARRSVCQYSMVKENSAAQRQTSVTT